MKQFCERHGSSGGANDADKKVCPADAPVDDLAQHLGVVLQVIDSGKQNCLPFQTLEIIDSAHCYPFDPVQGNIIYFKLVELT